MKNNNAPRRGGYIVPILLISIILVVGVIIVFVAQFLTQQKTVNQPQPTNTPVSSASHPANIEYDPTGYGSYNQSNLTNPNIGGVDVNMNWVNVQPQQGEYNWAPADNEIAAWAAHGKKFTVIVRYIHEIKSGVCSKGGQYLPQWELARIPHFCSDQGAQIPDYFDPTFKADLQSYVSAIAQHIAASPYKSNLEYIRIGVGMAGEGYPCISCSTANMQQLTSWGYSVPNWKAWQEEMLTYYKNVFSFTTIIYPLGDSDKDPANGTPVDQEVAYWAAAQGIGIGQQGLVDKPKYKSGHIVAVCKYVRTHYPSIYIQFQTVNTVNTPTQVQGDIDIANDAGAWTIEWYTSDTANSAYQPLFQQWQSTINTKRA